MKYVVFDKTSCKPTRIVEKGIPSPGEVFLTFEDDDERLDPKKLSKCLVINGELIEQKVDEKTFLENFEPPFLMYIELLQYFSGVEDLPLFEKFGAATGMTFEQIASFLLDKKKSFVQGLNF